MRQRSHGLDLARAIAIYEETLSFAVDLAVVHHNLVAARARSSGLAGAEAWLAQQPF